MHKGISLFFTYLNYFFFGAGKRSELSHIIEFTCQE